MVTWDGVAMDEGRSRAVLLTSALLTASSLLLVTGCSVLRGDPVEEQWQERSPLPSCGEITLAVGERLDAGSRPELACLEAARAKGDGAELVAGHGTVEGDPITEYYRVLPEGGAEVFIDATQDKFGSQRWEYRRCHTPTSALDVNC
jgi:hypothetical protein